jgi:hypothetical protein
MLSTVNRCDWGWNNGWVCWAGVGCGCVVWVYCIILNINDLSPHQKSCHKLTLDPIPTSNWTKLENLAYPLLICFQTPTPKVPNTSFEQQPPLVLSYLASIIDLHKASLSIAYCHNHFPKKNLIKLNQVAYSQPIWFYGSTSPFPNSLNGVLPHPQCHSIKNPFEVSQLRPLE